MSLRAIIIGSGIAGLSAAIGLRRVGIDVTVYERAPVLTEVGAGISLWANALTALAHLGALEPVRAATQRAGTTEFRTNEGRRVAASFDIETLEARAGVAPLVAMIHRADLVSALAGCLPADVARYGFECVGVDVDTDQPRVRFRNGHADEADVVIGADGIRSAVRAALFGPQEPRYAGYTCWRGICDRPASVENGYIAEWWGHGKRVGITTLPDDRVYWWATNNEPICGHVRDERAYLLELFRDWADPVPALLARTPADKMVRNDIIDRAPEIAWSRGRVGLIGDAAHPTTPNFGQGGCMAIEDAVVLARCLQKDADPAQALLAFVDERYPRTSRITNESWQFGRVGQWENRAACWLRDRMLRIVLPHSAPRMMPKNASFDVGPLSIETTSVGV